MDTTAIERLVHELRQPLASILSNAQAAQRLLARGAGGSGEIREILEEIVACDKSAAAILGQVEEILRLGKVDARTHGSQGA